MRSEIYKHVDGFGSMHRVSKTTARKMFYAGYDIVLAPCRANMIFLDWNWWKAYRNNDDLNETSGRFDELVNSFEYYNCNNEMGQYTKFFVSEYSYKKFTGVKA